MRQKSVNQKPSSERIVLTAKTWFHPVAPKIRVDVGPGRALPRRIYINLNQQFFP
jgi:hypothetical protein